MVDAVMADWRLFALGCLLGVLWTGTMYLLYLEFERAPLVPSELAPKKTKEKLDIGLAKSDEDGTISTSEQAGNLLD